MQEVSGSTRWLSGGPPKTPGTNLTANAQNDAPEWLSDDNVEAFMASIESPEAALV